ncbi:MAG: hypothetical protein AAF632_02415 [Bacteroidota bacterium]
MMKNQRLFSKYESTIKDDYSRSLIPTTARDLQSRDINSGGCYIHARRAISHFAKRCHSGTLPLQSPTFSIQTF